MIRMFELQGQWVKIETRQIDVECWEFRITRADGTVEIKYFSDLRLLDRESTSVQRQWKDKGWHLLPADNWVPSRPDFAK